MKILIAGASGLVGSALSRFLTSGGHQVYKMTRGKEHLQANEIPWDPERGIINPDLLEGFDAVVNLAGESIMGRWNADKKERILSSRVNATVLLAQALGQLRIPPAVFVSASAVGYYGDRGEELLTEQSPKGKGFLSDVCQEWEEATHLAQEYGVRTVILRLGTVLSPAGGALKQMLLPFKLCLGGQMGTGEQYMSWIALDDLVRVLFATISEPIFSGPVNAVSPNPVTNRTFTQALGEVLHRPTFLTMPAWVVKSVFGEMGQELLLSSQKVKPERLEQAGFTFSYPQLYSPLHQLAK